MDKSAATTKREESIVSNDSEVQDAWIEVQVVGAIRLALEDAANDETALTLVKWLVDQAPATLADNKDSVRLFIDGIHAIGGSVLNESPSGAWA